MSNPDPTSPVVAPSPWRTGRKVGRTLYAGEGDGDLIGVMGTRELAARVVLSMNLLPQCMQALRDLAEWARVAHIGWADSRNCRGCALLREIEPLLAQLHAAGISE